MSPPNGNVRRTLPAPHEPIDVEALLADHARLRAENILLREKVQDAAVRKEADLVAEVHQLREELARLREPARPQLPRPRSITRETIPREDIDPPESGRLPPPSALPAGLGLFAPADVPTGGYLASDPQTNAGIDFSTVARLSPGELDKLPFGLICLDAQGRVVQYNDTESRLARLSKERVIGKNFFRDVAPCTRVRDFEGQFYDLVRDPSRIRVRSFVFVFRFRHSEQHVTIILTPARTRGLYNMALLRRSVVQH